MTSATYGDADVMKEIVGKYRNTVRKMEASNDFIGFDPVPGETKDLVITYTFNGEETTQTV